jgi:hypothetical protein
MRGVKPAGLSRMKETICCTLVDHNDDARRSDLSVYYTRSYALELQMFQKVIHFCEITMENLDYLLAQKKILEIRDLRTLIDEWK